MTPEELRRLASREFSAVLASDEILADLRRRLFSREEAIPATLEALLLSGGDYIGKLPYVPLTAAKWAFLWVLDHPFVTGKKDKVSVSDVDLFLYILCCPDLRKLSFPLPQLVIEAREYSAATGLTMEEIVSEIREVIRRAFAPLAMLPPSEGEEEPFFDGVWLAQIAAVAVKESAFPYDRVIHELPLSLLCAFYVAYARRESMEADRIRRPPDGEIMEEIEKRVEELGKKFLKDTSPR